MTINITTAVETAAHTLIVDRPRKHVNNVQCGNCSRLHFTEASGPCKWCGTTFRFWTSRDANHPTYDIQPVDVPAPVGLAWVGYMSITDELGNTLYPGWL